MEKVTVKGVVHARINQFSEGGVDYSIHSQDMSQYNMGIVVQEVEIEIDAAKNTDIVNGTVNAMRDQQKKKRAEAEKECTQIEEAIQRLLCIENSPSVQS